MKKLIALVICTMLVNGIWAQWTTNGPYNDSTVIYVEALTVTGSNIFAGTADGVFLSDINMVNWSAKDSGFPPYTDVVSLVVNGSNIFAGAPGYGVFLSTNNGGNWTAVNNGLTHLAVLTLGINGTNLFASTYGGSNLYLSNDNGANWSVPEDTGVAPMILSFAFNGSDIFAGGEHSVFLSNNNGGSWTAPDSDLNYIDFNVNDFNALTISGSNMFAGTSRGILVSNNNAVTWNQTNDGLTDTIVFSIAINGTNIFAGTDSGVFLSSDKGAKWMSIGLANLRINSLALTDSMIFAGTDSGVWQRPLSQITGIQQILSSSTGFNLYPNPANNSFIIETSATGQQKLQMYDLTGQLLLSQTISSNKTTIDASGLAAGVYAISLQGADGVVTKKLVVAR